MRDKQTSLAKRSQNTGLKKSDPSIIAVIFQAHTDNSFPLDGVGENILAFPAPQLVLFPKKKKKTSVMEGKGEVGESQRRGRRSNAGLSKIKTSASAGKSLKRP